jgi:hypothetical protein
MTIGAVAGIGYAVFAAVVAGRSLERSERKTFRLELPLHEGS